MTIDNSDVNEALYPIQMTLPVNKHVKMMTLLDVLDACLADGLPPRLALNAVKKLPGHFTKTCDTSEVVTPIRKSW